MKIGDLVRIERFRRSDALFMVLDRDRTRWDADQHNDSSKFAGWIIQDTMSGKVYTQFTRELGVVSEGR